jgi:hypothetical protein
MRLYFFFYIGYDHAAQGATRIADSKILDQIFLIFVWGRTIALCNLMMPTRFIYDRASLLTRRYV